MSKMRLNIRIGILGLMTLSFAAILFITLFDLQLVQTVPEAAMRAERRYTTEINVAAARGEIFDRYGRPLITNKLSYNITLNHRQMIIADANEPGSSAEGLLSLIALCRREDIGYEENFPVTFEPYSYINETTRAQERLARFLDEIEQPDLTAAELMEFLRERYGIPERFSDDDARLVVGVRYELELRNLFFNIPPYIFADDITLRLLTLIEERRFPGVSVNSITSREYQTDYAAHLLGRVGPIYSEEEYEELKPLGYALDAIVGRDGIEKAAEQWLRGIDGVLSVETTASGQITEQSYKQEPQPGSQVFTTLDLRLQEATEHALERGIYELRASGDYKEGGAAEGGAAAIINVNTGEVLALASYPTFSLKDFNRNFQMLNEDALNPMYNRAIAGTYAPGSIFKMCTGIAALEYGIVRTRTTIYDHGRYMFYAPSYTPRCHVYPGSHGSVNIAAAIKVSCNYYFYEVGRLLGIDRIGEYAAKMGLGQKSGIEIDGERFGVLAGIEYTNSQNLRWNAGDTIQSAIGQSYNSFTPLQMAVYTATIANGGLRYRPHLMKSVRSYDFKREAFDIMPEILDDLQLDPDNIKAIQEGMRQVAQAGGTGARTFASYYIPVAAKTGTAQTTANRPDNGVFVAYAPYDNPEIAVAVVVEKGAGGSRVAPIAREIFTAYFQNKENMASVDIER